MDIVVTMVVTTVGTKTANVNCYSTQNIKAPSGAFLMQSNRKGMPQFKTLNGLFTFWFFQIPLGHLFTILQAICS